MIVEVYVRDHGKTLALLAKRIVQGDLEMGLSMNDLQKMVSDWHYVRTQPNHCEISHRIWWESWAEIHG